MKRYLITAVSLLSVFCCLWGQTIPQVKLADMKGRTVESASLTDSGVPVVISFWSTTCNPCIAELDVISELYPEWREVCPFRMIAVSVDDSRALSRARAMVYGRGWDSMEVLFDSNSDFKRAMNVVFIPQLFIFDKEGELVYSHTGYKPGDEDEIWKVIRSLK